MDDLTEWLKQQLDDEAEHARALADLFPAGATWSSRGIDVAGVACAETGSHAAHIARWDPDRVLAEVDAKRRILDERDAADQHAKEDFDRVLEGYADAMDRCVKLLALPYAGRDGWREEWATLSPDAR